MLEWWSRMAEMTQEPNLRHTKAASKNLQLLVQKGRDTPESPLPAQCGSLGTLMDFKPVLNPLLGPSLLDCLLLVSTSTIFFPSTATWILHMKFPPWSILCMSAHPTYWDAVGSDLSWAILRTAPVIAENAGVLFVSHCQELELYVVRTAHTSSESLVLTLRCSCLVMFFSPFRMRWYLQGRQEMAPESLLSLNLFLHIVLPSPTLWKISKPIDSKGKLEEWQRCEKSPKEGWF